MRTPHRFKTVRFFAGKFCSIRVHSAGLGVIDEVNKKGD